MGLEGKVQTQQHNQKTYRNLKSSEKIISQLSLLLMNRMFNGFSDELKTLWYFQHCGTRSWSLEMLKDGKLLQPLGLNVDSETKKCCILEINSWNFQDSDLSQTFGAERLDEKRERQQQLGKTYFNMELVFRDLLCGA